MEPQERLTKIWISLVVLVLLSLLVSCITFGVLSSSAEGVIRGYRLGGAIAAFGFAFLMMTSVLYNMYKLLQDDQIKENAKTIEELRIKLLKGAPCPRGYTVDIDEEHKLVFARPKEWQKPGGVLYSYLEQTIPGNDFTANFNVIYLNKAALTELLGGTFDPKNFDLDQLYRQQMQAVHSALGGSITYEYVTVDGLKSAKYIITYSSTALGMVKDGSQEVIIRCCGVLTYVPRLKAMYVFSFTDKEADFLESSQIFNAVTSSIGFL